MVLIFFKDSNSNKAELYAQFLKCLETMNHKTLEDVEDIVNRLKEEGYDETPENWYVDGEELLNELKTLAL